MHLLQLFFFMKKAKDIWPNPLPRSIQSKLMGFPCQSPDNLGICESGHFSPQLLYYRGILGLKGVIKPSLVSNYETGLTALKGDCNKSDLHKKHEAIYFISKIHVKIFY